MGLKKLLLLLSVIVFIVAAVGIWDGSIGSSHFSVLALGLALFAGSFLAP